MTTLRKEAIVAWSKSAACAGMDTEIFFPSGSGARNNRLALAICRTCPVRDSRLDAALDEEKHAAYGVYGIRGGLTAEERRQIIRRRTGYAPEPRTGEVVA